jgi:hypothetical protein
MKLSKRMDKVAFAGHPRATWQSCKEHASAIDNRWMQGILNIAATPAQFARE